MLDILRFSEVEILAFSLILLRVSAFIVAWPVFGTKTVPIPVKILFSFVLATILLPIVSWQGVRIEILSDSIAWLALREVTIGVMLGFICRMFFFAVSVAGQVVSLSIGLSNAQVMNPALESSSTPIEQFEIVLATLFFLAINGHHLFLEGLVESFNLVPMSIVGIDFSSFYKFGNLVQEVVTIGIKMAAPVLVAVFFMNLSMGIIGRAVPQINVLVTSLPVNILTGFIVMLVSLPMLIGNMDGLISVMAERLFLMMKTM